MAVNGILVLRLGDVQDAGKLQLALRLGRVCVLLNGKCVYLEGRAVF